MKDEMLVYRAGIADCGFSPVPIKAFEFSEDVALDSWKCGDT